MQANGFVAHPAPASKLPEGVRHVVLIVKEGRSYDDILGDIGSASNGRAMGSAELAHLGSSGFVDGRHVRMSLRDADITPNHHAIAEQFALLDNYYCNGVLSADGHAWATEGYVTDYLEKAFGGFTRSYPFSGEDPISFAPTGFGKNEITARLDQRSGAERA